MTDIEREEMIEQAHKLYDNSRNLISELRWQRTYFCRGTNIITKQEKIFNIWIFDECLKRLEERKVGKWEETIYRSYDPQSCETYDDGIGFRCSNCANAFKVTSVARYHYCPNCGAVMEDVKNER